MEITTSPSPITSEFDTPSMIAPNIQVIEKDKIGGRQYFYVLQTVFGPYEKQFFVEQSTLDDAPKLTRALKFFREQFLADLRAIRTQLSGWTL